MPWETHLWRPVGSTPTSPSNPCVPWPQSWPRDLAWSGWKVASWINGGFNGGLMVDFMVDFMGIEWVWLNAQNSMDMT